MAPSFASVNGTTGAVILDQGNWIRDILRFVCFVLNLEMHLSTQVCKSETLVVYRILYLSSGMMCALKTELQGSVIILDSANGPCIISLSCSIFSFFFLLVFFFFLLSIPCAALQNLKLCFYQMEKLLKCLLLEQDPNIKPKCIKFKLFSVVVNLI